MTFKHFSVIILSAAIIFLSLSILIAGPKAVQLVEKQALVSAKNNENIPTLIPQAAGAGKEKNIQIVSKNIQPPNFTAQAVIAVDFETGQVLYQKNIDQRLAPASTTKLMTALVGEQFFKPASILTVLPESMVGGSVMGLNVGEKLTYRSLLYGMLLNSGNDAAFTIALNSPNGLNGFIEAMNAKALEMGLENTHYQNPAGFDNPNHYSSAHDLAKIAKQAALDPQLSRVVATRQTDIVSFDKSKEHILNNLNKLLSEEGVLGMKTGFTENAGESFVGLVDRKGHKVITVVLNSQDRFAETKALMDWVYLNYDWQEQTTY